MFHPRPFVKTRFAPQGAVACLTAISDFYYTVLFRWVDLVAHTSPPPPPRGLRLQGSWEGSSAGGQGLTGSPLLYHLPPHGLW